MFQIRFKSTVMIEGCPESGMAAIDWRKRHGLPEAPTNKELLEFDLVDEQLVRELGGGDRNADLVAVECHATRTKGYGHYHYYPGDRWICRRDGAKAAHHVVTPEAVLRGPAAILREIYAQVVLDLAAHAAAAEADSQAKADEYFSRPWPCLDEFDEFSCRPSCRPSYVAEEDPRWAETVALCTAEQERRRAVRAAEAQAEEEQESAKTEFLHAWTSEHGSESERQRLEDGLLSDKSMADGLRDSVFASLKDRPRYARLHKAEVCTCDYPEGCEVSFEVDDAAHLDPCSYQTLRDLRDTIQTEYPLATVTARWHSGTGSECGSEVIRYSALVTVQLGPVTVSREFAL